MRTIHLGIIGCGQMGRELARDVSRWHHLTEPAAKQEIVAICEYSGGEQEWRHLNMGYQSASRSISGQIFEFGFTDSILQMWAAYIYELVHGHPLKRFAGCVTPDETAQSHVLFTAALVSEKQGRTVSLD